MSMVMQILTKERQVHLATNGRDTRMGNFLLRVIRRKEHILTLTFAFRFLWRKEHSSVTCT